MIGEGDCCGLTEGVILLCQPFSLQFCRFSDPKFSGICEIHVNIDIDGFICEIQVSGGFVCVGDVVVDDSCALL